MNNRLFKAITIFFCVVFLTAGSSITLSGCSIFGSSKSGNKDLDYDIGVAKSSFNVTFLDVGHGDAALVECDGNYMLIDGGDTSAESKIRETLEEKNITTLDILAVSHTHKDHIGGLPEGLSNVEKVNKAISNTHRPSVDTTNEEHNVFTDLTYCLAEKGSELKVAKEGEKFSLGSANVEVVYSKEEADNDGSLVLLVTYGNTRFLFTGDVENAAQEEIYKKYHGDSGELFKIDVMKMPHHGSYEYSLYNFIRTFMPDYCIISDAETEYKKRVEGINLLENYKKVNTIAKVYKTYENGDIIVASDGERVTVVPSKGNNT